MAGVRYDDASCTYPGAGVPAVDELALDIADGEFMVLVGPSGSGKSTALRMLAGLEAVTSGSVTIDGRDVSTVAPKDRDIAMVFQSYALYPHMTARQNMGFALRLAKMSKDEQSRRVEEAARALDLTAVLDRKPKALSGGQRQRVAMGRAIVREPSVFLMDEPLSNLDAALRVETRAGIAQLQSRLGTTTVYVTHDQVEAMTLGHRVAVLKDGVLQQVAEPRTLYDVPANIFVATFIGSPAMNVREASVTEHGIELGGTSIGPAARAEGRSQVQVGFRPEDVELTGEDGLPLTVTLVEELGADAFVYGTGDGLGSGKPIVVRSEHRTAPRVGKTVRVRPHPDRLHLFDHETGRRLS